MYSRQGLNEIAVPDALPLWECWRELSETYEAFELDPSDYVPEQLAEYGALYGGLPEGKDEWVKCCVMGDKASNILRNAIVLGNLTVYYIADDQRPAPLARLSLNGQEIEVGQRIDWNAGRESPTNRALLWVKKADWNGFLSGLLPGNRAPATKADRAPSVKTARPPSDDAIKAKADEMKTRGLDGRMIAKTMRHEPGFEHVGTTMVRELIAGRYPRGRQPRKKTAP